MMKILEVRDGFIKFEADKSIFLSSFVRIDGTNKRYVAQIVRLKKSGEFSIAYAKILFLLDDGCLKPYDKTLPSEDSKIEEVTSEILDNSIATKTPIIIGKVQNGTKIITDASAFDKKMLASMDDKNASNLVIKNLTKQFNSMGRKVVIIDTLGVADAKKVVASVDFKLPLDTESLAFMYQDCLNDATAESKSLIIEIFKDLSEYSKSVPFLPFGALKSIVDDMVDNSHVFKLLVLKNKLAKFDKLGYFAKDKNEVDKLDSLLDSKCVIVDISKLDNAFQNRYLAYLYEKLQKQKDVQVFLTLSNTINKKNLKNILSPQNSVPTTIFTHSRFKYLNDIKNLFDNFIIMPSFANNEIFKVYATFLSAMPKMSYLITGEAVNYIPLVSNVENIDEVSVVSEKQVAEVEQKVLTEKDFEEESGETENFEESEIADIADDEENNDDEIIEEIIEEPEITREEIIANIEEKSNAVITDAINDIAPLETQSMFGDDEDETVINELENIEEPDCEEITEEALEITDDEEDESESIEDFAEISELTDEVDLQENISEEFAETDDTSIEEFVLEPTEEEFVSEEIVSDENTVDIEETGFEEITEEAFEESEILEAPESELEEIADVSELTTGEDEELFLTSEENNEIEVSDDIDLEFDTIPEENIEEEKPQMLPELDTEEIQFQPIMEDFSDLEEIVELSPDESDDNDIVIDIDEEENVSLNDEEIVKEVDKVFTTRKDDDISDSDLDFIDELNSDELQEGISEELSVGEEDGILEEPQETIDLTGNNDNDILETRNSSTPMVPVYDADIPQEDMVTSDPIEQGDTVVHAKYGSGVVEKMIKYGNKTLFSINFDNIGRRLLDPTLTEIKKA